MSGDLAPFAAVDPTTGEEVIYAPQRSARPLADATPPPSLGHEDAADCPFCPGREAETPGTLHRRPAAALGPWRTRCFPNRYPLVAADAVTTSESVAALGHHEVIVDTPRHGLSFADDPPEQAEALFLTYRDRLRDLAGDERWRAFALFRNQGAAAGASQFHSHSQLAALAASGPIHRAKAQRQFADGGLVLRLLADAEAAGRWLPIGEELVAAWVPAACRFPLGVWLAPTAAAGLAAHYGAADDDLAAAAGRAARRLILAFGRLRPGAAFNLMLHTAPRTWPADCYRWHWELAPRLTGLAGFELGTGRFVNTVTPAAAAVAWAAALAD